MVHFKSVTYSSDCGINLTYYHHTLGAFDILIYTDKDQDVPEKWEESGPQFIANSQEVRLRSFSTIIHKVNAMVAYKN